MCAELIGGAAVESAVGEGITFVKKHSKYVLCFNSFIQTMEEKLRALKVKRRVVLGHVAEGEWDNEIQEDDVKEWLKRVEKEVKKVDNILENINKSNSSCICCNAAPKQSDENANESMPEEKVDDKSQSSSTGEGAEHGIQAKGKLIKSPAGGFVLNPWTRWRTSKDAEDVTKTLQDLEKKTFERYTRPGDPRGLVTGSFEDVGPKYYFPKSRWTILEDINKALMDPKIGIVGLWGPSGVGKSTLLNEVVKHVKLNKFGYDFDEVARATVTRTPDIERIQAELADWLKMSKLKDVNSTDNKALKLRERLGKGKKVLIILDDLAREINLEKIGIPTTDDGKIRLLLTSRNKEVLEKQMASKMNFMLEPLKKEEAFELFKKASNKDVDKVDEETSELIKELLTNECAGLPLSIVRLAIRLRSTSSLEWKDTLEKLRRSNDLGVKNFIDEMLESSFDVLDSAELKSLFLLCGQIGSQIISVEKLVIYGMGLGIFDGIDTMQKARDRVNTLLEKLWSYYLLIDKKPGFIKINDCLNDVALGIALKSQQSVVIRSGDQLMKVSIKEDFPRCKSISLLNVSDIDELPQGLSCPEFNMFTLVSTDTEDRVTKFKLPDAIFQDMKKLKVLELFGVVLVPVPQSIQLLHHLQTLCLDSCDIEDFMFLGKLKQLQVLIIRKSEIVRLPKEIAGLTDLRFLDLSTCDKLQIIEQGILGRLTRLEELHLPKSFRQWDEGGVRQPINASLTELSNMPRLSALGVCIPETAPLNRLPLENLMRYSLQLVDKCNVVTDAVQFDEARILSLDLNSWNNGVINEDFVQNAAQKAQELHLSGLLGFEKCVAALFGKSCTRLEHIEVQDCPTIEYIINLNQHLQFPSLESLTLESLANLKTIVLCGRLEVPFCNLKAVTVTDCDRLRHLFSFSVINNLSHVLEKLEVGSCDMFENIVAITTGEGEGTAVQGEIMDSKGELLGLKALRNLKLHHLPKFLSFCSYQNGDMIEADDNQRSQLVFLDGCQVSIPCLESLSLSKLPGLRELAHHQHPPDLRSLKSLKLSYCDSLVSAIQSKLLLMLTNLEVVNIDGCNSMEVVFEFEEELSIMNHPLKPDVLKLSDLANLKKIWSGVPKNISFLMNLRELEIAYCRELTYVFSSSMVKSMENLSHLSIIGCESMKGVIMDERSSHEYHFPCLKELMIKSCSNMNSFISLGNESDDMPTKESFISSKVLLPSLEKLVLERAGRCFQSIWDSSTSSSMSEESFHKLTYLYIKECHSVTVIFPSIMVKRLQHLQEVCLRSCPAVRVLFESGDENLRFSKLNKMELFDLPKLTQIVRSNSSIQNKTLLGFPSLTDIRIEHCGNLINLFDTDSATAVIFSELKNLEISSCQNMKAVFESGDEKLRFSKLNRMKLDNLPELTQIVRSNSSVPNKTALEFPSLTDTSVEHCRKLISLFDTATAMTLSELKNLNVHDCMEMKEVFSENGGDENVGWKTMAFNKLLSLQLCKLEELTHFCSGGSELSFPALKKLQISECGKFEAFIARLANAASPLFDDKVMLPNLQDLFLSKLKLKEIWDNAILPDSFSKLQVLGVVDCNQISVVIPSFMLHNLHNLEQLTVNSCDSVEVVFLIIDGRTFRGRKLARSTVCKLKKIHLRRLPNLRYLCNSESFPEYFLSHKLESLEVEDCGSLRNLFTTSTAKNLKKLEELTITKCEKMKVVVAGGNVSHNGGTYKTIFPQLSVLKLNNLPELVSFWNEKHTTEWPSLKQIEIKNCNAIEAFVADSEENVKPLFLVEKETWGTNDKDGTSSDNNKSGAFPKLESIQVKECSNLLTIFPSSTVEGFWNLEELTVWGCIRLKEVFQLEDCNEESPSADDTTCFQKLQKIYIRRCYHLERLFPTSVARCLQQLSTLSICDCPRMEEIVIWKGEECNKDDKENACHPPLFFPKLTSLTLEGMPLLNSFDGGLQSTRRPLLQHLTVLGCPEAKIFSLEQQDGWNNNNNNGDEANNNNNGIPSLSFKETYIKMDMLQIPDEIIGNPTTLILEDIEDEAAVKAFPWWFLIERPHNLEKVEIRKCGFEEILPWSASGVDGHGHKQESNVSETGVLLIENVRHLKLQNLPKLKHMCSEEGSALADVLSIVEILEVETCPLLTGILFPSSVSFNNLKEVKISYCHGLRHVLTTSTARCLVHLTKLEVWRCENIEEIVTHEDDDFNGDQNGRRAKDHINITFHQLRRIELYWLPSLKRFSSVSCNFNFPRLTHITLTETKGEEFFSKSIVRAPLLSEGKRRQLGIQN